MAQNISMQKLNLSNNQITNLNIRSNKSLQIIALNNNNLTDFDMS